MDKGLDKNLKLNDDLEAIFALSMKNLLSMAMPNKIAVAVSGGVDSMALLHLIDNWRKSNLTVEAKDVRANGVEANNIEVHILHINHGIRAESKQEEEFVKNIALSKGLVYFCGYWHGSDIKSSIQELARQQRYDQMSKYCHEHGIPVLLTAHHKNDAIENYVFRKNRGASRLGLSSSFQMYHNDIRVIRPLAQCYKDQLVRYMQSKGHKWYEDASNSDSKYSRNRIRRELSKLDSQSLQQLEHEIAQNDLYCQQLSKELVEAIANSVSINNYGVGRIDLQQFRNMKEELQIPLLSHVLTIISGAKQIPRYRNLEKLLHLIRLNNNSTISYTMHSCKIIVNEERGNNYIKSHYSKSHIIKSHYSKSHIIIYKEIAKIITTPLKLLNGLIWDSRFRLLIDDVTKINTEKYTICAINTEYLGFLKKKDDFMDKLSNFDDFGQKKLILTLPIIKKLEKVVAVPHIFYYDDDSLQSNLKIIFEPSFVSRFTHF